MRTAYLTIDDAPSEDFPAKLDYLVARSIPAVFFCPGQSVAKRMEYAVAALQQGYPLGNHSFSHPHFSELTLAEAEAEISAADEQIEAAYATAGIVRAHKYFRFPYGDKGLPETRAAIQAFLRALGYTQPNWADVTCEYYAPYKEDADFYWTFDSHDWVLKKPLYEQEHNAHTPADVLGMMDRNDPHQGYGLNSGNSAEIVLVHDRPSNSLFTQVIEKLETKGFTFSLPE